MSDIKEMVTISKDEYDNLLDDSILLNCLRGRGVDNWGGWDDAVEEFNVLNGGSDGLE